MRFRVVLELHGKTATGVQAPEEVVAALGSSRRPAVKVTVPGDLASALDAEPTARVAFEAVSYSNKRGVVTAIETAQTDETRQRHIAKSVATLLTP